MAKLKLHPQGISRREHITQHKMLHAAFDALVADYLLHHPMTLLGDTSLAELMRWSFEQTLRPTPPP